MNRGLKVFLIFSGGFLFGVLITFTIIGKITQSQFAERYSLGLIEQAMLATQLRANKQNEISEMIESRLPSYVLAISQNEELRDSANSQEALWHVKNFYEANSISVPIEISEILNNLPPEPPHSCEIR